MSMEQQDLIESGVADISQSLGFGEEKESPAVVEPATGEPAAEPSEEEIPKEPAVQEPAKEGEEKEAAPETQIVGKAPPKTWPKEMHEHWAKTPAAVQEYWEKREEQMLSGLNQYREYSELGSKLDRVIAPYKPMLAASGATPEKAVEVLLNANYRLNTGPMENRRQAFIELGTALGIIDPSRVPQEDPRQRETRERLANLEGQLEARRQAAMQEARTKTELTVAEFAKDKPYFDEVADEVVAFINAGIPLDQSYERALWANPAVRAKELARHEKEAGEKLKAKSKAEVDAAKRGTAANVRERNTGRAPTESKGKFLDVESMKEDLRAIKAAGTH